MMNGTHLKTFSERKGLKAVRQAVQVGEMDDALRASIWNVFDRLVWTEEGFIYDDGSVPGIEHVSRALWEHHFKIPADTRPDWRHPGSGREMLQQIRKRFFDAKWFEVYDFVQFMALALSEERYPDLIPSLNFVLERELAGYRIVGQEVVDITSPEEVEALEEALRDTRFAGVSAHLQRSLQLLSDRKAPDYRNSIKESILAVESMARVVAANDKATLADALKALEKSKKLHTALKDGFGKLYGYVNDEQGIRHAMLDEPNLTAADARYFLLSCTSFVNYLKAQLP